MIHAAERMAGIELRDAGPADVPAITSIYAHAVKHGTASFEIDPPDEAEIWRRMQSLLDNGFPYLVAEANGVVTGYAYAGPYRPRPAYRYSVEDSVYVHPKAVRRGVGRALLARLIEESAKGGFRQMIAVIGDSTQQAPSIELHRALGFRTIGTIANVGFKGGRWLDSMLMQLALGKGATTLP
jgi:L-amino acid N-acyltransferase YncA